MNILEWVRFLLTAVCLLLGLFILVASVLGVYKFDYVLNRMHAAAMGDTLGIMFVLLGLIISAPDVWVIIKLVLVIVFLWVGNPVGSHLIARLEVNTNPVWAQQVRDARQEWEEGQSDGRL